MKITVHSSKAVKPAYDGVPPATAAVPLTVFDKANFDTYISLIHAFRPPAPPNAALEAGLAKVLAVCRERAGRLGVDARGNRTILLTDEGARFVEATADVALDSVMPLEPTAELLSLHPMASGDGAAELLLVQVTRFACGSLVVGSTMQHIIGDGGGTSNFFMAWGQATRGVALDPAPVPVHARASMFPPRDPPRVEFEHRGVEFKPASSSCEKKIVCDDDDDDEVVVQRVHLSREFIAELKSAASAGAPRPYSTLVCVVAHLWRCITAARGLDECQRTSLRIAVDGRARMSPRVPDGYTGNVVLWARPTARAGDLVVAPLRHAAALIHREVARMDDAYFKSFVDFASSGAVEEEGLVAAADAAEMVLSPDVEVDSCLQLPFCYDLDFGGGRPFFFITSYMPVEGVLMLVRSFDEDGGVDAYVPLFSRHMDTFNNCCYSTGPSSKTYNWPRAKF